jgi:long-chain acyl-CoA synthetase
LVTCLAGIAKTGAVAIPLHPATPGAALERLLQNSEAKVLIAFEAFLAPALQGKQGAPVCQHLLLVRQPGSQVVLDGVKLYENLISSAPDSFETWPTKPQDPAVILYTSGTTGQPKGVVHSHSSLYSNISLASTNIWSLDSEDVVLLVAAPSTIFAQTLIWGSVLHLSRLSLLKQFEFPDFLKSIENDKVTFFAGVPTIAHYMLHVPIVNQFDLSSLKKCFLGGAAVADPLLKAFEQQFKVKVSSGYGMTEGVPFTYIHSEELNAIANTAGRPAPGMSLRIIDEAGQEVPIGATGEITVRGPQVFSGYFHADELNKTSFRDDWFHTGDIGRLDKTGYLYLIDRLNNMIKRSGYKVYSAEVEQVLLHHPAVAQAAVIGIPDEALGEEIKACVVLKPGGAATAEELIAHCKAQLEAYKYPRLIEFWEKLPMTPAGKISHLALRADHAAK